MFSSARNLCRGSYPSAEQYLQFAEKSRTDLVEAFKSMQIEDQPLENGDTAHEDEVFAALIVIFCLKSSFMLSC